MTYRLKTGWIHALNQLASIHHHRNQYFMYAKSGIVKGFQEAVVCAADNVSKVLSIANSPATAGTKPGAYKVEVGTWQCK